jgi:segregation and condensation protein A
MRPPVHIVERRPVMTLDAAIERLEQLLDIKLDWASLEQFLPPTADPEYRRSALASSFVAALELARQGRVMLDQKAAFEPLMLRRAQ